MKEKIKGVQGHWQDTIIYEDGRKVEGEWHKNQIQASYGIISARLFKTSVEGEDADTNGFKYLALGEGDSDWDLSTPVKDNEDTQLLSEIDRIEIDNDSNISYLDPETLTPSVSPTSMLEISVLIDVDEGIGDLREFGLFCGDATGTANSGTMFNWVSHTKITKTTTTPFTILRKIRIHWGI